MSSGQLLNWDPSSQLCLCLYWQKLTTPSINMIERHTYSNILVVWLVYLYIFGSGNTFIQHACISYTNRNVWVCVIFLSSLNTFNCKLYYPRTSWCSWSMLLPDTMLVSMVHAAGGNHVEINDPWTILGKEASFCTGIGDCRLMIVNEKHWRLHDSLRLSPIP